MREGRRQPAHVFPASSFRTRCAVPMCVAIHARQTLVMAEFCTRCRSRNRRCRIPPRWYLENLLRNTNSVVLEWKFSHVMRLGGLK